MDQGTVEVPSYFLCPISLQIMRDPVTLSTGITYDRESIEHWLFSCKHSTCPITNQPLSDISDLTPNHTLRRLIQAWCVANASERFPTPRPSIDRSQILILLDDAKLPNTRISSIKKLRTIISESDRNRRCVEAAGAADILTSIIKNNSVSATEERNEHEALAVLYYLNLSDQTLILLLERNPHLVETLTTILNRSSNYESRAYAMLLLDSVLTVIDPARLMNLPEELFQEIVRVLKDRISAQDTKAALHALHTICPWGSNRVKAAEAGAVSVLIERLMEEMERRPCEMILVVLDQLCRCAEGRAELIYHAAGLSVVSKKMMRVSPAATKATVRIVYSLARMFATSVVLQEMLEVGVVRKLCMLVQMDCGESTRDKVKEMLKMHSRVWMNSPCASPKLQAAYFLKLAR